MTRPARSISPLATISGGTISTSGSAQLIASNDVASLIGTTLAGTLDLTNASFLTASLNIVNGLILNNGRHQYRQLPGTLTFKGTQTLDGTGTVSLANGTSTPRATETSGTALTIASGHYPSKVPAPSDRVAAPSPIKARS